jgi:hypothetical protein
MRVAAFTHLLLSFAVLMELLAAVPFTCILSPLGERAG